MTFYHQKEGNPEQKIILEKSIFKMNKLYELYNNIYKRLTKEERKYLWNMHLKAKKEVEKNFEPFGFICY